MHMISKKDLNDAEMDTLTKSCSPTTVITAIGEVQTHEELEMGILDNESPRGYASSLIAQKSLRWKRIFSWMDQRSKTTSHLKRDSDTISHGELRSDRSSNFICNFLKLVYFNLNNTFKTGESSFYIYLKLVFLSNYDSIKRQGDSRQRGSEWNWFLSSASVKFKCWTNNRTVKPVVCRLRSTAVEFWNPGAAARIQRKSCGWKISWTRRLSRQFFSWSFFRADYKETWGFG